MGEGGGTIDVEQIFEVRSDRRMRSGRLHGSVGWTALRYLHLVSELLWLPALVYGLQLFILVLLSASVTVGLWTYVVATLVLTPLIHLKAKAIRKEYQHGAIATALKPCQCIHCVEARVREDTH